MFVPIRIGLTKQKSTSFQPTKTLRRRQKIFCGLLMPVSWPCGPRTAAARHGALFRHEVERPNNCPAADWAPDEKSPPCCGQDRSAKFMWSYNKRCAILPTAQKVASM